MYIVVYLCWVYVVLEVALFFKNKYKHPCLHQALYLDFYLLSKMRKMSNICIGMHCIGHLQGGRTWQLFVGGKNGHENFRQAGIYNFREKCVVFARNRKFANLTQ